MALSEKIQQRRVERDPESGDVTEKFNERQRQSAAQLLKEVFLPNLQRALERPAGFPAAAYAAVEASRMQAKRTFSQRKKWAESCAIAKAIAGDLAADVQIPEVPEANFQYDYGSQATMDHFDAQLESLKLFERAIEGVERSRSDEGRASAVAMEEKQQRFLELVGIDSWDQAYSEGKVTDTPREDLGEAYVEHTLEVNGHTFTWITDGFVFADTEIDKGRSSEEE